MLERMRYMSWRGLIDYLGVSMIALWLFLPNTIDVSFLLVTPTQELTTPLTSIPVKLSGRVTYSPDSDQWSTQP
ncbi:MAG: hypothetical protein ACJAYA_000411, partial [Bacteroidia bacterium]